MKTKNILALTLMLAISLSCSTGKKKNIVQYYTAEDLALLDEPTSSLSYSDGDEVDIPFRYEGGVKYVQVKINGFGFEMIFDTGCSAATISSAEAGYLYEKGWLTDEDILGQVQSRIADGSITNDTVVNLREVVINDQLRFTDVKATVSSSSSAPLLLGNEVLDRVKSVEIDNANCVLKFRF